MNVEYKDSEVIISDPATGFTMSFDRSGYWPSTSKVIHERFLARLNEYREKVK